MSDAVNARIPKAQPVPSIASSGAATAGIKPLTPAIVVERSRSIMSNSNSKPAQIDPKKIEALKKTLDELKSPSVFQVLGAVAAGVFLGLLSLAATLVAGSLGTALGAIVFGVGALMGLVSGTWAASWCFSGTVNLCHFIMKTENAQAEAIEKFAKEHETSVPEVMKALEALILNQDLIDNSKEHLASLTRQIERLENQTTKSPLQKSQLQQLKHAVHACEQVISKYQQWGNNPVADRNIFPKNDDTDHPTYEHAAGTTQHMVLELREKERLLLLIAPRLVEIEEALNRITHRPPSQAATAQLAAVVAAAPVAA